MDKVIDGVDISECSYAITPKRQCPNKPMPYAKETSCISCKEHNTKLNFCKNNPDCYFKQLKRLQAENERLKENDCEQCKHLDLYIKYKQTLQEIKDIAREWLNNDWSCFHCRSNMDDKLQDILDKINEVIGVK